MELSDGFSSGSSPAEVSFDKDVVLGPNSTTLMELAGTETGEYDRLLVAEVLDVAGELQIELLEIFFWQMMPASTSSMPGSCPVRFGRCCCRHCRVTWIGTVHSFIAGAHYL